MKYTKLIALLLFIVVGMPVLAADNTLSKEDETVSEEEETLSEAEFALLVAESALSNNDRKCLRCHDEEFIQYESGIHASVRRQGNTEAPVCTDCHITHRVRGKLPYKSATGAPCSKCHDAIFEAYAVSVHSQIRVKDDEDDAHVLGCPDCHRSHDVTAAATENQLKESCLACHEGVLLAHEEWLPNAGLHFEAVSCPACHAPAAQRKVDLRLYDNAAKKRIREKEGVPQFESRARAVDLEGKGLSALALQSLLREFNRDGGEGNTSLRGRLEVSTGVGSHQLTDKGRAIRDCEYCHQKGADPFQSVTISIGRPDGRSLRYDAHQEVLNSAVSIESVHGFYAIGATRIKLLDILLILSVVGGITVPIGHMTIKWLFRRRRRRGEGQGGPKHAGNKLPSSPDDRSAAE
jgi:hypothetical protein